MTPEPEAIPADVLEDAKSLGALVRDWMTGPAPLAGGKLEQVIALRLQRLADRAPRAPVDGAGWRPIETAPKDGTRFLAFEAERENQRYECWWQDDFANWAGWQDDWDDEPDPTHWMPLPAAPGTHPAPASPDAEMARVLVDSLRHSFITSQSDGSEDEYRLVAQFKTLLELQQAYAALMDLLSKHEGPRS